MIKFYSLLKMEHHQFKFWYLTVLLFLIPGIYLAPGLLRNYTTIQSSNSELRLTFTIMAISLLIGIAFVQYIASMRMSIKQKELWLHNSSSIFMLLGVKVLYPLLASLFSVILVSSGFFFLEELVTATVWQLATLILLMVGIVTYSYLLTTCLITIFYALGKQLQRYIGKISVVVTFVLATIVLEFFDRVTIDELLPFGYMDLGWLASYLPKPQANFITFTFAADFYIVPELIICLLLLLCFIIGAKWIERVITH